MLMLCSVGIALALLGTVLLHHASARVLGEGAAALRWSAVQARAAELDPRIVQLAFVFALVGYGAKAGLAPMHGWMPDAYAQAPAPAAALLATAFTAVTLHALLRFHAIAVGTLGGDWSSHLLTGFGVLSLVVAVPLLVLQGETKRLLAWSSLEHTGLVVLAVGLGSPLAVFAGLLHLVTQSLAKALAFLLAGTLLRATGSRRMDHATGLLRAHPPTALLLLVAGAGLVGMPPAATAVSEWLTLAGGLATPRRAAAWIALAALTVAFLGLAFHFARMLMGAPVRPFEDALPGRARLPLAALAAVLVLLGVWLPSPLRALVEQAARVVRP
jgi:hydrogenase-4 component F